MPGVKFVSVSRTTLLGAPFLRSRAAMDGTVVTPPLSRLTLVLAVLGSSRITKLFVYRTDRLPLISMFSVTMAGIRLSQVQQVARLLVTLLEISGIRFMAGLPRRWPLWTMASILLPFIVLFILRRLPGPVGSLIKGRLT